MAQSTAMLTGTGQLQVLWCMKHKMRPLVMVNSSHSSTLNFPHPSISFLFQQYSQRKPNQTKPGITQPLPSFISLQNTTHHLSTSFIILTRHVIYSMFTTSSKVCTNKVVSYSATFEDVRLQMSNISIQVVLGISLFWPLVLNLSVRQYLITHVCETHDFYHPRCL